MVKVAIVYSLFLIGLGIGAYMVIGGASITALIPAFLGVPALICSVLALNERRRKHCMHTVVALAFVGACGSFQGMLKLPTLYKGLEVARPVAVLEQSAMFILSLLFLVLALRSFIAARLKSAPA